MWLWQYALLVQLYVYVLVKHALSMLVAQAVSYTMQICCAPWVFFLSGNSFQGLPSVAYNSLNIPQISFEVEFGFIGSGEFKCITCFSLPVEEWLVDSFTTKKGESLSSVSQTHTTQDVNAAFGFRQTFSRMTNMS